MSFKIVCFAFPFKKLPIEMARVISGMVPNPNRTRYKAPKVAPPLAIAVNDMEVCYIPKVHLLESITDNPDFAKAILLQMAKNLKVSDNVIVNIAQKTVKQRLAEAILHLDKNFGVDAEGFILMTLTREGIANILGTAKETCIRALTSFKKQGWISTDGKRIKIKDHKALLKLAENR